MRLRRQTSSKPTASAVAVPLGWASLATGLALSALATGPVFAAAPLPPEKPRSIAPVPVPLKRPRVVPLPPSRPAELLEEDAEAAAAQAAEGAPAQLASRTAPEEAPQMAPPPVFPGFGPPPVAPQQEAPSAEGTEAPAGGPQLPPACAALVAEGTMVAELEKDIPAKGSCGLPQPVRLTGMRLSDGRLVAFRPASVSRCEVAAAVVSWVREDLAGAVAAAGGELAAVRIAASYDCRPRNRIAGARMSEHGLGNAVDVGGFELSDARVLKVEKGGLPPRLRAAMKESACRRFTTVLGPGSDGYHEDHIHVDLAQRRLDIRLCRWTLDAGTTIATGKGKEKPKAAAPVAAPPAATDDVEVSKEGQAKEGQAKAE